MGNFRGDIDRNEVELDLNKFVSLLQETYELKEKIRQLEVDGTANPWVKWLHFARTIDAYRIFPRLFITVYMWLLMHTSIWFMNLEAPTMEQAGLISVVVGAGAAWFGLYVHSGGGQSSSRALQSIDNKDVVG
jgi:hypothetical protein